MVTAAEVSGGSVGSEFNPFHGEQLADPYPFYARARREEPVFYSPMLGMWYVTRYDDIVTVARDPVRFCSSESVSMPLDYTPQTRAAFQSSFLSHNSLTDNDPPSHTKVRGLVNKAFTGRRVAGLEGRIRRIAEGLIDGFVRDGHADLVQRFNFPLPMRVILNVLGAPESDLTTVKQWVDDWMVLLLQQLSPEQQEQVVGRLMEAERYWVELIEARRAEPADDLVSDMVRACLDDPDPVGVPMLVNVCLTLALAGHETTTNLLGNCVYRLLSQPRQWQLVLDDPANAARAVEETLRADSPVQALMRTTTEPVELGGVQLPKGARVALLYASAGQDEAYFADAARFDLTRTTARGHLAFGHGIHHCVGAPLARLESRIAVELLAARLPGLRLSPDFEPDYETNPIHRGLRRLPVDWDPPAAGAPG